MTDAQPVLDQLNLVVRDMDTALALMSPKDPARRSAPPQL